MKVKTNGKDVFQEAAEYVAEMEKLQRAEARALAALEVADAALLEARRQQSAETSQILIDGGELPAIQPLPQQLKVEQCRAALLGIRKRIAEHDIGLLSLRERFNVARAEHNKAVVAQFLKDDFKPAAATYAAVLKRGAALATALGEPFDLKQPPADGTLATMLRPLPHGDWERYADAKKLHAEHVTHRTAGDKLFAYGFEAERRLKAKDNLQKSRQLFDPKPGTKYRVIRPFGSAWGRDYDVGDVVDSFSFDPELLRLEVQANKLLRVLPEDEL